MEVMGDAYWAMIAEHGKVSDSVLIPRGGGRLRRLTCSQFNDGYLRMSPSGEVTTHEYELWDDHENGTVDVIEPDSD